MDIPVEHDQIPHVPIVLILLKRDCAAEGRSLRDPPVQFHFSATKKERYPLPQCQEASNVLLMGRQ